MKLSGGCHCGALSYRLDWPDGGKEIPARRCTCTYCTRFGGTWTSHPDARLVVACKADTAPSRYRFGTGTADFLFCSVCGVPVAAIDENSGSLKAVINVHTLDCPDEVDLLRSDSNFKDESTESRLQRRSNNWIGQVRLEVSESPR